MSEVNYNYATTLPPGGIPEGQSWGLHVETLGHDPEALNVGDVLAGNQEVRDEYVRRMHEGDGVQVLDASEEPPVGNETYVAVSTINMTQEEYDAGVAAGRLQPNAGVYGNPKTFFTHDEAKAGGLLHLNPDAEYASTMERIERSVDVCADADYMELSSAVLNRMEKVHQVFEFSAWGRTVRMYNFSETAVSEQQLAKVANALREMGDETGGGIFDVLGVMAILPSKDPFWGEEKPGAEPGTVITTNATTFGSTVYLNERIFADSDTDDTVHVEPTADALPYSVAGSRIETIVFHELTHVEEQRGQDRQATYGFGEAVGWEYERMSGGSRMFVGDHQFVGDTPHKSRYAVEPSEDIAETAAARFAGGAWHETLDETRDTEIEKFFALQHSDREGPTFVTAKELDLHALPHKLGLGVRKSVIVPRYTYYIEQQQQSAVAA